MACFVNNMKVMETKHPSLMASLSPMSLEDRHTCLSRSGLPTLIAKNTSGQTYFLHSYQDPVAEAESLLGDRRFASEDITVLFGFGLGYLAQGIQNRMEQAHDLIVIEQRPDVFEAAMSLRDLTGLLSDPRIRFCIGSDKETVIETLNEVKGKALSGTVQKLLYGPAVDLAPEVYGEIERGIEAFLCELKTNLFSFQNQIPLRVSNLFCNLPFIQTSTSAAALKNSFQGLPAVVVSAGPSLDGNIEMMRRAHGKVPIIAVDAALKPLLASRIMPDMVATLDPIEKNSEKFAHLSSHHLKDISLVFAPEGNGTIAQLFTGPCFYTNSHNSFTDWLIGHFGTLSDFPPMYTVAHLAFFLARYMGCDPIILAGFDFSFPENRDHAKDCAKTWTVDFEKEAFIEIEDVFGEKVKTCDQFLYMLRLMEREIRMTEAMCIDATEGGARIRGTTILSMEEALNTYLPAKRVDVSARLKAIRVCNTLSQCLWENLRWLAEELNAVGEITASARDLIETGRQKNRAEGSNKREALTTLATMKNQIVERNVLMDVLGDLLSDLLIHEIRSSRKTTSLPSTEQVMEDHPMNAYAYFFSRMDEIVSMLSGHCQSYMTSGAAQPSEAYQPTGAMCKDPVFQ